MVNHKGFKPPQPWRQNHAFGRPTVTQFALPLLLTLLAFGLWCLPQLEIVPQLSQQLDWSRTDLLSGQWWRLFSGHLLHSNGAHLAMNVGALWLIFGLHQLHYHWRTLLPLTLGLMLAISLFIGLAADQIDRYVGLSGLLHGLITWGAIKDIQRGWFSGWLLLLAIIAKVCWELTVGASASTSALIEARVAVEAHGFGVLAALLICGLGCLWRSWQQHRMLQRIAAHTASKKPADHD